MSSKYERKRKRELDADTSIEGGDGPDGRRTSDHNDRRSSQTSPPPNKSRRKEERDAHHRDKREDDEGGNAKEESLSIEETNKLRVKLGLAPLDTGEAVPDTSKLGELAEGESPFVEDGITIVHKAAKSLTVEKESVKLKEKLEAHREKRRVQSRVLKIRKTLAADSVSDDERESTAAWIERSKRLEEERKRAEERAKLFDEADEAFGLGNLIDDARMKATRGDKRTTGDSSIAAGLVVGHSKEAFADGKDTVLVLKDKGVLDDNDDEVLINPNLLEDEHHKRNVELRKRTNAYRPYEEGEELDELTGARNKQAILAKYDEGLDGEARKQETFRLNAAGGYDLDAESREAEEVRRRLMAKKNFISLQSTKYTSASEFYTEEEMISFRRPKKKDSKRLRKRNILKASELAPEPEEETAAEKEARIAKLAARRREAESATVDRAAGEFRPIGVTEANGEAQQMPAKLEDGELLEEKPDKNSNWKKSAGAIVDINKLKKFAENTGKSKARHSKHRSSKGVVKGEVHSTSEEEDEEDDGDDFIGGVNLIGVVIDDDAGNELDSALEEARRRKLAVAKAKLLERTGAEQIRARLVIKREPTDEHTAKMEITEAQESTARVGQIVFDVTSEQYKLIGENPTLGLAGNRDDYPDVSAASVAEAMHASRKRKEHILSSTTRKERQHRQENGDGGRPSADEGVKPDKKRKKRSHKRTSDEKSAISTKMEVDEEDAGALKGNGDKNSEGGYTNVLGEEKDVTKGVAAMLKLASVKGYLETTKKATSDGALRQSLESKRFSKLFIWLLRAEDNMGNYTYSDIEDKTMRKLERLGTTGTGPIRPFAEKRDYSPSVEISYPDAKGRPMSSKEAFRSLSWKFHGKGPGKKQIEKHQARLEKKEKMKKMNSMDTPLGTLSKQRKKQEQLQTPYLVLSGAGRDTGAPLQKD